MIIVLMLTITNSNFLAKKMAGPGDIIAGQQLALWFTVSMTVAAVFSGIILLCYNLPFLLAILESPLRHIVPFIEQLIYRQKPQILNLPVKQVISVIAECLKTILAVYLVLGAPHFVKRQLKLLLNVERQ